MSPTDRRTPAPVAGIDGWRKGWVIARLDQSGPDRSGPDQSGLSLVSVPTATAALEATSDCVVVAVDMPMALPSRGSREAEAELRRRLGRSASSVFTTPTRAAVQIDDRAEASELNRSLDGPGISVQAWGLVAKVRELRAALRGISAAERWFETHPETAFTELNGATPMASKKTAVGVAQRQHALRRIVPDLDDRLLDAPAKVPVDDVLDAIVAAWSAMRIATGDALVLGPVGRDDEGFEQSIRI